MTKTTITINGRTYDAITGMPVPEPSGKRAPATAPQHKPLRAFSDVGPSPAVHHLQKPARSHVETDAQLRPIHHEHHAQPAAQAVHSAPEKSHTLYRKALKKPEVSHHETPVMPLAPEEPQEQHATHHAAHQRSPLISKFGSALPQKQDEPAPPPHEPGEEPPIAPATVHPTVARVLHAHQPQHHTERQLSGTELKEQLIKERLAEVSEAPAKKERRGKRPSRMVAILSSSLALLVLGGYLTYLTLPSISLRVAASRAGVNASMPEYKPDGYSLDGPITYSPGEVIINYKSNTNADTNYKLTQKATNWDSQAVLDNYVTKVTDNYLTFQEHGITVYTFNNKAAWVNGGLLYTLDGNAGLSSDQILRIATSM